MREENFWCKKPRYSEVRVIARRVIARYDCICYVHLYQIESVGDITYYAFSFLLIIFQWNLKVNLNLFLCAFSKSRLIIDQPWFMIYFQDEAVFA